MRWHTSAPSTPSDEYSLHPGALLPGNQVDLLVDGDVAYPAMLDAIAAARRDIHLETYIFSDDPVGHRFIEALGDKARQGVKVRVIVDAIGSFGYADVLQRKLRETGAQCEVFHPVAPWRRRWGWSIRDHRKLLVVDGEMAFAGGLNIGDEYLPRSMGGEGWHDVHVRLQGPAVRDLQKLFAATWRYVRDSAEDKLRIEPRTPAPIGTTRLEVLHVGSRHQRHQIRRQYYFAMKRARERITIQASYFVAERALRRVLRNAVTRGVEVRLMLPPESDVPPVQYASRARYTSMLKAGVRIYEWMPSMLHSKTVVVDKTWCAIGSYNLDQRSLLYNWELALAIVDAGVGARLEAQFDADIAHCREIDLETWSKRSLWERLLEQLFYPFRRWL